jgi:hypothetical protein
LTRVKGRELLRGAFVTRCDCLRERPQALQQV